MQVPSRILKAALWAVWLPIAQATPPNLRQALQAMATAQSTIIQNGAIKTVMANGQTTTFADFNAGNLTADQFTEIWVYLVDEYDRAESELCAGSTDAQIETQMESNLRPIKGWTDNWMYISK